MKKCKISELYHYVLFEFKVKGEDNSILIDNIKELLTIKHAEGKNELHELFIGAEIIIENKKYIIDRIGLESLEDRVLDFEYKDWLFKVYINISKVN